MKRETALTSIKKKIDYHISAHTSYMLIAIRIVKISPCAESHKGY